MYSAYGLVVFGLIFVIFLPLFLMAMFVKPLEKMASFLNHLWARIFFFLLFLNRTKIRYEVRLDRKQRYVFCANHMSFLDIPTMGLINHNFKFIGKSSLRKVPVWGYMYSKLHVLVDRENMRSRHDSWIHAKEAVRRGFSMTFFPEGGIYTKNPPKMVRFKEGAFRVAVDEQIPIVPVTLPTNFRILPDGLPLVQHPGLVEVYVHRPIWPDGNNDDAVKRLKQQVYEVIDQKLVDLGAYESR